MVQLMLLYLPHRPFPLRGKAGTSLAWSALNLTKRFIPLIQVTALQVCHALAMAQANGTERGE